MERESTERPEDGPGWRQSAISRTHAGKSTLLRLVIDPEGHAFIDLLGKAPGRGTYVAPSELPEALTPKGIGRLFRGAVKSLSGEEAEAMLAGTVERLEARVLELIGLCRRAGNLAVGMDAVLRSLAMAEAGKAPWVLIASDFSERSRAKVEESLPANLALWCGTGPTMEQLGQAIGRDAVGVLSTTHPNLGKALETEAKRLASLRAAIDGTKNETTTRKNG